MFFNLRRSGVLTSLKSLHSVLASLIVLIRSVVALLDLDKKVFSLLVSAMCSKKCVLCMTGISKRSWLLGSVTFL